MDARDEQLQHLEATVLYHQQEARLTARKLEEARKTRETNARLNKENGRLQRRVSELERRVAELELDRLTPGAGL